MKFRSERDSLADVFNTASRAAVGKNTGSPVLGGLLVVCEGNRLVVTGTDLSTTIRVEHEVIGINEGSCVIPARLAAEVVRSLEPGAVTIEADEKGPNKENVEISAAKSRFSLRVYTVVQFPTLPASSGKGTKIDSSALVDGLRQVVLAASTDDSRPILTGVVFTEKQGSLRLVATDSYRLSIRDIPVHGLVDVEDILVPARALGELSRLFGSGSGEVLVTPSDNHISFQKDNVEITTSLLSGQYPDYLKLFPDNYPNKLHLGKDSMLAALRRMRLLLQESTQSVKLMMHSGGVDLNALSQEVGDASETVEGDYTGEDLTIAFNPKYLIEGIEAVRGDEVIIETVDTSKPAMVKASDTDEFQYLLMPIKVP